MQCHHHHFQRSLRWLSRQRARMPVTEADLELGLAAAEGALDRLRRHHAAGPPDAELDPELAEHAAQACVRAMHLVHLLDRDPDPRAENVRWHLSHLTHGLLPSLLPEQQVADPDSDRGPIGLAHKAQWLLWPDLGRWLRRVRAGGTVPQVAQAALVGLLTARPRAPTPLEARRALATAVGRYGAWVAGPLCWTTDHLVVFAVADACDRLPLVAVALVAYWQPQALLNYLVWPQCSPLRDDTGDAPCRLQPGIVPALALALLLGAQLGDSVGPDDQATPQATLASALHFADVWGAGDGRPAQRVLVTAPCSAAFQVPLQNALATAVNAGRRDRWSGARRAWASAAASAAAVTL